MLLALGTSRKSKTVFTTLGRCIARARLLLVASQSSVVWYTAKYSSGEKAAGQPPACFGRKHRMHSMGQVPGDSPAFRQALLLSEKRRITAVILFVGFFTLLIFLRIFVFGSTMSRWAFLATAIVTTIEVLALRSVNKALQASGDVSPTVWYFTITLETLFPAVGIAFMTSTRLLPDYRLLATPWALVFLPFIFLSVLRLNTRLCIFSGIISAIAYLAASYLTGWRPASTLSGFSVTQTAVLTYSIIFILSGFLGGGVAA